MRRCCGCGFRLRPFSSVGYAAMNSAYENSIPTPDVSLPRGADAAEIAPNGPAVKTAPVGRSYGMRTPYSQFIYIRRNGLPPSDAPGNLSAEPWTSQSARCAFLLAYPTRTRVRIPALCRSAALASGNGSWMPPAATNGGDESAVSCLWPVLPTNAAGWIPLEFAGSIN